MWNIENSCNKIEELSRGMAKIRISRRDFFKSLAILTGSLILLGKPEYAYAHPPSDIIITFDPETKMLKAILMHKVSNPLSHYINKVEVGLNGKEIIEHTISRQDNNESQTVAYFIPDAKAGDVISVECYCSISGKLKKEITIKLKNKV